MKILHIGVGLSLLGGIESVIYNLANEMCKHSEVTVCSLFKPSKDGPFYTRFNKDVKLETLGFTQSGFSIGNLWKIFLYLKNADIDIVHIHGFFYYYALPILLLRNKKFFYTVHSDAKRESSRWDKKLHFLKKYCFKHHLLYPITISEESQTSFYDFYHLESRRIFNAIARPVLSNTISIIDNERLSVDTKVFLHPGRISEPKNQVVLCKVFQRLINEGHDIILLIAGSNQEEKIFQEMKPFFCDRIKYIGERNDIPQMMYSADGFCLPSIWEGLPITLLEALSVGCIPICSPVGGIVNVIEDGINGILSMSSNEDDYYEAMKRFLSMNKEEIKKMKSASLQSFTPYDIKHAVKEHYDYYASVMR